MVFYKYRGFSSRMSEGFRFLTKNMKVILKTSLWVLLPISLIQALVYSMYAESVMEFSTMAGKTPDALQAYGAYYKVTRYSDVNPMSETTLAEAYVQPALSNRGSLVYLNTMNTTWNDGEAGA